VVFADAGGEAPGLIAFAHVAKAARDALLAFTRNPAPEVLSGHGADGNPSTRPHLAVVPLADVGWMHSTGRLLGFAFVLPRVLERDRAASDRQAALEAMVRFARSREPEPAGLRLGRLGLWLVARTGLGALRSLDPSRYVGPARRWATVTPLMLDRYPKDRDDENAEAVVGQSCENLGLPRPTLTALYKHSAVRGAPSVRPSARSPEWTSWTFPRSDSAIRRPLVHAILEFEQPVRGPLILGAGRYLGLGLCLPIDRG